MPRPDFDQQVTFLYADDAPACWDFYERVMELPLVQNQGRCRIYEVAGGRAYLGLCMSRASRVTENPRVEGGVVFTFIADDVDGWYEFLKAKGVAIPHAPELSVEYKVHHFFFHDPAGNTLEIQRFERPDWPRVSG
jgi:catechol 2,3-dioxygenase-like lactoylglutathione lyase family enzyme